MTSARVEPKDFPLWRRLLIAARTEVVGVHPRLHAYNLAVGLLSPRGAGALRARLLRLTGASVGEGTEIHGTLKITGPGDLMKRLQIGRGCSLGADCMLDLSEQLSIGDGVTIEPGVMILTSTHELDFPQHRAGKILVSPVTVGEGAWLQARAVVLPGVKIGEGAVVEAGAVVNKDVEPNTRAAGNPAVKREQLGTE